MKLEKSRYLETVKRDGFCVVKKVFPNNDYKTIISSISKNSRDSDLTKKISLRSNSPLGLLHKFNIGSTDHSRQRFASCYETIYVPQDCVEINTLSEVFAPMIELRNALICKQRDFVSWIDRGEGLWSACRLQHYFRGGGFFDGHRDVIIEQICTGQNLPTIQLVGVLSKRGRDFESGGAYIRTTEGVVDLETDTEVGDVIVYDGSSFHGVSDIDSQHPFTLEPNFGRWSALVSLYRLL